MPLPALPLLLKLAPYAAFGLVLAGSVAYTMGQARSIQRAAEAAGRSAAIAEQAVEIERLRNENEALQRDIEARLAEVRRANDVQRANDRAAFSRQLRSARQQNANLDACLSMPSITPRMLWAQTGTDIGPGVGEDTGT